MARPAFDRFPLIVTLGDRTWRGARVIATDDAVRVYTTAKAYPEYPTVPHLPTVALVAELHGAPTVRQVRPRRAWELTADGQTLTCESGGGCGCGSPLRRIRP